MSKGSKRRPCQVSREEETLRYALAFGEITFEEWFISMQKLKIVKDSRKGKGVCIRCIDGLMTDSDYNYSITCRIDSTVRHRWDTCAKFREEK